MSKIIFVFAVATFAVGTFSPPAVAQERSTSGWNPFDLSTWRQSSAGPNATRSSRAAPMVEGRNVGGSTFAAPTIQGVEPYISLTIEKDRRGSGR